MPQFKIPVEKLPPPNVDGNHVFRFRIVSDDRNSTSEYSSLYVVQSKGQIYPLQTQASASVFGDVINISWETPSIYNSSSSATLYKNGQSLSGLSASVLHNHGTDWKVHDADIFVNWYVSGSYAGYIYYGRSKDNSLSIIKKAGATKVKIIGQVANYPPTRNDIFKIFETAELTL